MKNSELLEQLRKVVKDGKIKVNTNRYGYIQLEDRETGERICLGSVDREEEYGFNERGSGPAVP